MEKIARKGVTCPKCQSQNVAKIVYGYVHYEEIEELLEAGKIVLAGCEVEEDSPSFHCNNCEHEWTYRKKK